MYCTYNCRASLFQRQYTTYPNAGNYKSTSGYAELKL